MAKLKMALLLLIGHALGVLVGTAVALMIFGFFRNINAIGGMQGALQIIAEAGWLSVALYTLSFMVALPFTLITALLFLGLGWRSATPYLVAGAVLPAAAIIATRFIAVDDPFALERGAAITAGVIGGIVCFHILWFIAIRPIRRGLSAA